MRRALLATLLLLLRAAPAAAQWRTEPMELRTPSPGSDAVPGVFQGSGAGSGLLVGSGPSTSPRPVTLRPWRDLLTRIPQAITFPGGGPVRGGRLAQAGADGLTDVAWSAATAVQVVFGSDPATVRSFTLTRTPAVVGFAHLLPRDADVLAMVNFDVGAGTGAGRTMAVDFDGGALPAATERDWSIDGVYWTAVASDQQVYPVRLSPVARQLGVDDLVVASAGGVFVWWQHAPPGPAGAPALAGLDLGTAPVKVGGVVLGPTPPPWLPATVEWIGDALGAAAFDVDGDGVPDLVFGYANAIPTTDSTGATVTGHVIWVKGTGNPDDLATADAGGALLPAGAWHDLTVHPDLQPLPDPVRVAGLDLLGTPMLAIWDRTRDEIVVASAAGGGRLHTWRAPTGGGYVEQILLADVVGSPAPDLVVVGDRLLVYPDTGDASPVLAWAPGSPGAPVRGEDHPMAVEASDADGPFRVDWLLGDPDGTPAASGLSWTLPGADLCAAPPQQVAVTARAVDALGVFVERSATLDVGLVPPALDVAGAAPPSRLVLPPGGTSASFEGSIWSACGRPVTFTWGGTGFPAAATVVVEQGPTWTRQVVQLPEAAYPALLAGTPELTLAAVDDTGLSSPAAHLPLDLDARGLVAARQDADRAVIGPGELAVIRTRLGSRLGVALPRVSVRDALAGLAPAGAPRVTGATVVEVRDGGAEVVLDALPPAGAEVVVELPVRGVRGGGAAACEARSEGGHLLTPAADAPAPAGDPVPGCGCGAGGAAPGGLALLLAAALRRPRRASAAGRRA